MSHLIHYLPVVFLVCLFFKPTYFSWLWLTNCLLLAGTIINHDIASFSSFFSLDFNALPIHTFFKACILLGLIFGALFTFKSIHKLTAFAAYFTSYYALEIFQTHTWTEFILHFELVAIFSALLLFAHQNHAAKKAAFSYLLMQIFAASCLIAGSLIVHDNTLSHFEPSNSLASYLIAFGLLLHAAAVPFHSWFVQTLNKVETSNLIHVHITMPLLAVFGLTQLFTGYGILIYAGSFASIYASSMLIVQNRLRSIVSYLSIATLGLVLVCVGLGLKQSAFFLIGALTMSILGYLSLTKTFEDIFGSDDLFILQDNNRVFSTKISVLWLVFSFTLIGLPFLGYAYLSYATIYKNISGYAAFSWLNYIFPIVATLCFYSLVLKPLHLFSFKNESLEEKESISYHQYVLAFTAIFWCLYSTLFSAAYKDIFLQFAVFHLAPYIGALPLFYLFRKTLGRYRSRLPKDDFLQFKFPKVLNKNTEKKSFFYATKLPRPRVKIFYFESIENSMSYALVVFFICMILFLWL